MNKNLIAKINTNLFSHSSGGQKVTISITRMGSPQGFEGQCVLHLI